mgnify:CR=1 FL=1
MKRSLVLFCMTVALKAVAQDSTENKIPFDGMDMTWQNGSDRRQAPVLQTKYFTGSVMLDANYTNSFHNPIDNTVVGSTALARNNEVEVSCAALGGEFTYDNAHAKIMTHFGTRSTVIPRNDYIPYRGQYGLAKV